MTIIHWNVSISVARVETVSLIQWFVLAWLTADIQERLYSPQCNLSFTHWRRRLTRKVPTSLSGASVSCSKTLWHSPREAGDWTSNLLLTWQPLYPLSHAAPVQWVSPSYLAIAGSAPLRQVMYLNRKSNAPSLIGQLRHVYFWKVLLLPM